MPLTIPKISIDDTGLGEAFNGNNSNNPASASAAAAVSFPKNRRHSFALFSDGGNNSFGGGLALSSRDDSGVWQGVNRNSTTGPLQSAFSSFSFVGRSVECLTAAQQNSNTPSSSIFQKGSQTCLASKELMDNAVCSVQTIKAANMGTEQLQQVRRKLSQQQQQPQKMFGMNLLASDAVTSGGMVSRAQNFEVAKKF